MPLVLSSSGAPALTQNADDRHCVNTYTDLEGSLLQPGKYLHDCQRQVGKIRLRLVILGDQENFGIYCLFPTYPSRLAGTMHTKRTRSSLKQQLSLAEENQLHYSKYSKTVFALQRVRVSKASKGEKRCLMIKTGITDDT